MALVAGDGNALAVGTLVSVLERLEGVVVSMARASVKLSEGTVTAANSSVGLVAIYHIYRRRRLLTMLVVLSWVNWVLWGDKISNFWSQFRAAFLKRWATWAAGQRRLKPSTATGEGEDAESLTHVKSSNGLVVEQYYEDEHGNLIPLTKSSKEVSPDPPEPVASGTPVLVKNGSFIEVRDHPAIVKAKQSQSQDSMYGDPVEHADALLHHFKTKALSAVSDEDE